MRRRTAVPPASLEMVNFFTNVMLRFITFITEKLHFGCIIVTKTEHDVTERSRTLNNLKTLRRKKFMTQQEIADALGIKRLRYQTYESGRRELKAEMLKKMAVVLKCSVDDILRISEDEDVQDES